MAPNAEREIGWPREFAAEACDVGFAVGSRVGSAFCSRDAREPINWLTCLAGVALVCFHLASLGSVWVRPRSSLVARHLVWVPATETQPSELAPTAASAGRRAECLASAWKQLRPFGHSDIRPFGSSALRLLWVPSSPRARARASSRAAEQPRVQPVATPNGLEPMISDADSAIKIIRETLYRRLLLLLSLHRFGPFQWPFR